MALLQRSPPTYWSRRSFRLRESMRPAGKAFASPSSAWAASSWPDSDGRGPGCQPEKRWLPGKKFGAGSNTVCGTQVWGAHDRHVVE